MTTIAGVTISEETLADFCERWQIVELEIFGSAAIGGLRPESDVDLLVTFADDAPWSLLGMIRAENELARLLGRPVDLIERSAVEASDNYIRRKSILRSAIPLYARER